MNPKQQRHWLHFGLLVLWISLGAILRLSRLVSLPPWTDEFATMVFSLGNSFQTVPLNQWMGADLLLYPLHPVSDSDIGSVVNHLRQESTHPPIYFVLTHLWIKVFPTDDGLVSLWGARSLSALLGIAAIPSLFGLGYLAFDSRLVGQIAAAMMAVSPYGIFLAQDARHYTLAILLVVASLSCLVVAIQAIHRDQPLSRGIGLVWVGVNSLGIATHYFFSLTLCAEGVVLLTQAWQQGRKDPQSLVRSHWRRIYAVAGGTLIGCIVWLPTLYSIYGSEPTAWIADGDLTREWLAPIGRLFIWGLSMILLLPTATTILPIWIVVISGIVTVLFVVSLIPRLGNGWKLQQHFPDRRLALQILWVYLGSAIALILGITYGLGMDLTLGARFQFVYFPAVILLLAGMLAGVWQQVTFDSASRLKHGKAIVAMIWLMGLMGGFTAIGNLGYLQNHRPDLLAPVIQEASQSAVFIATTHKHHGQTGRLMGLAWEFKRLSDRKGSETDRTASAQFFLADRDPQTRTYTDAIARLQNTLTELPRPFDLWLVDFRTTVDLEAQHCFRDRSYGSWAGEYKYKLYRCLPEK
ncbi:glycosyltransferase family 39 protein [Coleofasciculus sp. F4-SAH-05]|uniref:glycosyltransferase family 39 protein n=1 Tax=Coleofasciculus sp. F4-SAH-05 TaxID=3069525 RepID=UPI0032F7B9C3